MTVCLPTQRTRVRLLVQEDSTCHGAAGSELQLPSPNSGVCVPQLLNPMYLEPMLHKRSHCNKKAEHHNKDKPPLTATRAKPKQSNEDPVEPKIN